MRTVPYLGALCAVLLLAPVRAQATGPSSDGLHREAVVVGFNRSPRPALEPLRYADDDAVKLAGLLTTVSDQVTLLVEPDEETERLYPELNARPPERALVLAAIAAATERLDQAAARGEQTELFVAYSGHGDVDPEGRGLVYLADGVLTQRDLAVALGDALARHRVNLMVDACNAALLVGVRGLGSYGDRVPATRRDEAVDRLAQAGLILSTSGRAEVHEWELLLSGIFSYEVRSGLLGAADLDDDRRVTFAELDAFVAAANARITNPIAHLAPTIRGPGGHGDAVLIDLGSAGDGAMLRVTPELAGHSFLLDRSLVRYADFNREAEQGFWLLLLDRGPFALVQGGQEYPVVVEGQQLARLGAGRASSGVAGRGVLHDYYERHLFETPFGSEFASAHRASEAQQPAPVALSFSETARIVMAPYLLPFGISAGLAAFGGVAYGGGWVAHASAEGAEWADETQTLNGLATGLAVGGMITAGVGGALVLGTSGVLGIELLSWQLE